MSQTIRQDGEIHYEKREVVGVFPDTVALETAVEKLGTAGDDRAAIRSRQKLRRAPAKALVRRQR